ncbi:MAG: transcriptional repressor [Methanomassiliicoccales archaeon]|nr:transcriptional repressor [Methanomassiliicoccales archaeon]
MAASIIRWTKQLKVIVDIIYSSNIHLTADEVYIEAQKVYPNISLGTVYRNLNKLKTHAIISEVPMGTVLTFTKHPDTNAHFECDSCHRIYCISLDLESRSLSQRSGFNVDRWSLMMHGVCRECERQSVR